MGKTLYGSSGMVLARVSQGNNMTGHIGDTAKFLSSGMVTEILHARGKACKKIQWPFRESLLMVFIMVG